MQELKITGSRKLNGVIRISGAKNAALPALAATILVDGTTILKNMPRVKDVISMCHLLESLGAVIKVDNETIEVDTTGLCRWKAPHELVRKMRASVLVIGPLVARFGKAEVALPGGCTIGNRPIDMHINAMRMLGAETSLVSGEKHISCKSLKGTRIFFDRPTVTGTENVMMAATAASGLTVLENCAREPEIVCLANLMQKMGASIHGAGTGTITIEGNHELKPAEHTVISDRIEAGTYAIAAPMTGGSIKMTNIDPEMIFSLLAKMRSAGAQINELETGIEISGEPPFRPVDISTAEYPGFPTDLQAQFMAMMCLSDGKSVITENIFEDRFKHVPELNRLGGDIDIRGRQAFIKGVRSLTGAAITASDLRASASLVLAGLAAKGITRILRIYHLDRGYSQIDQKLRSLGAEIKRVDGVGP